MKILLVTHYYSPHQGGIEVVAGELAARVGESHDVTWAASDCDPVPKGLPVRVRAMPMRSLNALERLTGLPFPLWGPLSLRRLWRTVRDVDIVHLHDFAYLGNWVAFVAAAWHRVPVLITQHIGLVPYRSAILMFIQRAVHATAGRTLLGGSASVVFVSSVVRDYYSTFVRYRRPPVVVSNGVDVSTFTEGSVQARTRARTELGLDPSKLVLVFVGRFVEKKGLHILASLAHRLPEAQWLLAGRGPINPSEWKAPNVTVVENRRGSDLVTLYHAADLLVLPSVGEGLPLVVQEAMSCGTPVVVGEDTARAVNAPLGLVFGCRVGGGQDAERWEMAIRNILKGTIPPRSQVAAFARTQWSWTSCASAYADLYHQLTTK